MAGCGALCRRGREWMRNKCRGKLGVPEVAPSLAYPEQWEDRGRAVGGARYESWGGCLLRHPQAPWHPSRGRLWGVGTLIHTHTHTHTHARTSQVQCA